MPTPKLFTISIPFMIIFMIGACQKKGEEPKEPEKPQPTFDTIPQSFPVSSTIIEASGIASSKKNAGYLWVHEDGGSPTRLLLLKNDGILSKSIYISGTVNNDWEDMALSKGPDALLDYIYLADIGDNNLLRNEYTIYRFPEPVMTVDTIKTVDNIRLQYPDGSHNAEAILVDNLSKDIYIITKSDDPSRIYKLQYPQNTSSINTAALVGELTFGGVTGAAGSVDGKEVIIKTYPALNYFIRKTGETIEQALKKTSVSLPYQLEIQGEAVCFASDNTGFYTLSEKAFAPSVNLYFYKRK